MATKSTATQFKKELQLIIKNIPLNGKLQTFTDPATIGTNFQLIRNIRYTDTNLRGIKGMTKVNPDILDSTYFKVRAAYHYRKSLPTESHILVQAWNTGLTASKLFDNTTAIPSTGDFGSALYTEASGASFGRFSSTPTADVAYCNGKETLIYSGTEAPLNAAAFYNNSSNLYTDYSAQLSNNLTDANNTFVFANAGILYIGSVRPLQGFKVYISSANTTASVMTVKQWSGTAWAAVSGLVDGTAVVGKTLAQTGQVTFTDTYNLGNPTAFLTQINNVLLYWYQLTFSVTPTATTTISQINLSMSVQTMIGLWDGVVRPAVDFELFNGSIYSDGTLNVSAIDFNHGTASSFVEAGGMTSSYAIYVACIERLMGFSVFMGQGYTNTNPSTLTVQYWTGSSWSSVNGLIDGTSPQGTVTAVTITNGGSGYTSAPTVTFSGGGGSGATGTATLDGAQHVNGVTITNGGVGYTSAPTVGFSGGGGANAAATASLTQSGGETLNQTGFITWTPPAQSLEFKRSLTGKALAFYYKLTVSAPLSASVEIDFMGGITAPVPIGPYSFPIMANGRLMLCSNQGVNANSVIYSANGTSNVFSGLDSSTLYFGGADPLVAAAAMYSQFGSNLYNLTVFLKEHETWVLAGNGPKDWAVYNVSKRVGCIAPNTLAVLNTVFELSPGQNRTLAIWQDAEGIYLFDGRNLQPIHLDIQNYLDETRPEGINSSMMNKSVGFIDEKNQEYHWLFAQGTSTVLNKELVFDLKRMKWYETNRGTGKQLVQGISVNELGGDSYTYGFLDTGYMEQLDSGTTFDGNSILYEFQTGDMTLMDSLGMECGIEHLRLISVAKTVTTNLVQGQYYLDSNPTAAQTFTMSAKDARPGRGSFRLSNNIVHLGGKSGLVHSFYFSLTTTNETIGFEPLALVAFIKPTRESLF